MTVTVNGAELHYTTRGSGPVCLVLSAIGTPPYERQIPSQLDDQMTLVFVDLRGGGLSSGDPADLTFDVLADDLEAIRADLGVERVAVLGHSILGALAIEYGRRRPLSMSHVIAVGMPPHGDMAAVAAAAAAFFEADATEGRKQILHENLAALPPGATPGQALFARTPARFFDPRFDAPPLVAGAVLKPALLAHIMGPLTRGWAVTAGTPLRTPLLLAHGRYDYVVPHGLWDAVVDRLPPATWHLFARSGHQPFVEEPERFAEVASRWMARTRASDIGA